MHRWSAALPVIMGSAGRPGGHSVNPPLFRLRGMHDKSPQRLCDSPQALLYEQSVVLIGSLLCIPGERLLILRAYTH